MDRDASPSFVTDAASDLLTDIHDAPPTVRYGEAEDTEVGHAFHLEDLFDDDVSFDDFDLDLP